MVVSFVPFFFTGYTFFCSFLPTGYVKKKFFHLSPFSTLFFPPSCVVYFAVIFIAFIRSVPKICLIKWYFIPLPAAPFECTPTNKTIRTTSLNCIYHPSQVVNVSARVKIYDHFFLSFAHSLGCFFFVFNFDTHLFLSSSRLCL